MLVLVLRCKRPVIFVVFSVLCLRKTLTYDDHSCPFHRGRKYVSVPVARPVTQKYHLATATISTVLSYTKLPSEAISQLKIHPLLLRSGLRPGSRWKSFLRLLVGWRGRHPSSIPLVSQFPASLASRHAVRVLIIKSQHL